MQGIESGTFAKNKLMVLALAISLGAIVSAYAVQVSLLSSDIAAKNNTIGQQAAEIEGYALTIDAQRADIEQNSARITSMERLVQENQDRIDFLLSDISAKETMIQAQTDGIEQMELEIAVQNSQIAFLREQTAQFEAEISDLKSDLEISENQVTSLSDQLDDSKRIIVRHYGVGVKENGDGIIFSLEIEIIGSGHGKISLDVGNVQYDDSFQSSVRTAATVAFDYTGQSSSDKDIIIRMINDRDGSVLSADGPSASGVIAVMIIAGLDGKELDSGVLMTGRVGASGTISQVGSVEGKASAAADFGASTFLVPRGQEFDSEEIAITDVYYIEEAVQWMLVDS